MSDSRSLLRHASAAGAAASAIPVAVFVAFGAFGLLGWGWALTGAALAGIAGYGASRLVLGELERARRAIVALRPGGGSASSPPVWAPAAGLAAAAAETARAIGVAHERLERRSAAAEAVLSDLPDGVLRIDRARTVIDANPAAELLIGQAPVGQDLAGLLRDPGFTAAVERSLRGGGMQEVSFAIRGAEVRSLRATVRRIGDGGAGNTAPGEPAALIVLHDDTARQRLEQMRADFVANVSHELKTPLTSLVGFIETLRGPAAEDAEARARFLEIMQEQATRMRRLVDDIMSLSRIEMEEHAPPTGRVALLPLLQAVIAAFQVQAAKRRMTIRLEDATPPNDALEVIGDRDQIYQVFQNLIDNAIKYGREGSAVIIAVARTEAAKLGAREKRAGAPAPAGAIEAAVIDQGEGIPEEHLARLTERFYRVDRGRSRQMGGTGLGLAIVKHILVRHGGRLSIESRLGQGSRFTVYLPAAGPAARESVAVGPGEGPGLA